MTTAMRLGVLLVGLLLAAPAGNASAQPALDYLVVGRSGASYFNVPGESLFGYAVGGDLAVALTDDWGFVASANGNFIPTGAQLAASVGAVKLPYSDLGLLGERITFSAYFDQFTDSRVDTIAGSLYLTQGRLQLGYAASENLEFGAVFAEPLNEDSDVNFLFTNFPGSLPAAGRVDMSRSGGVYAAGRIRKTQFSGMVGFRGVPDTLIFSGGVRRPLGENLALFANGSYEENRGNWGMIVGAEFALRPPFGRRARRQYDDEPITAPSESATAENVSANAKSRTRFASLPGDALETPPENLGTFPLGLGPGDDNVSTGADIGELWTSRYYDWNARQITVLHAHEAWRGLSGLGLTNRNQQRIQSPFTGFNLRTNGGVGRRDGDPND